MDGLGHVMFIVRCDRADNCIRPARELARRVKSDLINHFDVSPRLGGPILLLADEGGKIVSGTTTADYNQQKSREHPFYDILLAQFSSTFQTSTVIRRVCIFH
jgi:hypothetical protein